jgi:hypothetical protein
MAARSFVLSRFAWKRKTIQAMYIDNNPLLLYGHSISITSGFATKRAMRKVQIKRNCKWTTQITIFTASEDDFYIQKWNFV